jgi:ABC-type polysaccharide/polyol phosphate export permease
MFGRFSDEARRVIVLGQVEARARGDAQVGTEHILLGLVDEGGCDATTALAMLQIQPTTVRAHIEQIVGRGEGGTPASGKPLPFTDHTKKMLELSSREAVRLGHNDIGTEHVLLGMVREGRGVGAQVLVGLGADLPRLRETVVELSDRLGADRERVHSNGAVVDDEDDELLEEHAAITAAELLAHAEPASLGAAATLPHTARARRPRRVSPSQGQPSEDDAPVGTEDESEIVSVFEPRRVVRPAFRPYVESLWERRRFMKALAKAEIRGMRSSTLLGSIWGLIDPIFQATIYLFLYFVIRGGQGRAAAFLPVLLGGIFLFRLTGGAINEGGKSVRNSKELMLSSTFPRAVLPLSAIYKGLINFVPTIFVFGIVYFFFGAPLHRSMVVLPVLFAIQTVTDIGLALIVSTIAVFVKDVENAIQYIVRILMFTTPVVYPLTLLPPGLRSLLSLNPIFPLFASYQIIIGGGGTDWGLLLQSMIWAAILLVGGGWLFLRYEHSMAAQL